MASQPEKEPLKPNNRTGRTSTGVHYDLGDSEPAQPQKATKAASRREAPKGLSTLLTITVVGLFALTGILFGESIWDAVQMPAPTVIPAVASITETATASPTATAVPTAAATAPPAIIEEEAPALPAAAADTVQVWIPASGSKYHASATCSGMKTAQETTLTQAQADGYTACKRCKPQE